METQAKQTDTECRDREIDEELADVLTAISVVSKRLARKLTMLSRRDEQKAEGGKSDEQDE
jgi:ribosome-associated translation inhibitor RaiA